MNGSNAADEGRWGYSPEYEDTKHAECVSKSEFDKVVAHYERLRAQFTEYQAKFWRTER